MPSRFFCFAARLAVSLACLMVGVFTLAATASAATPEEVDAAIAKGVKFLLDHENLTSQDEHEHFWEFQYNHQREEGGATSLVVYSLLAAGVDPKDAGLDKAIEYLKTVQMTDTYATGLRMQVWRLLPFDQVKNFVGIDGMKLMKASHGSSDFKGKAFYHYELEGDDAKAPAYDHSNSQYGVLGMWALAEMGGEISDQQWIDFDKGWRAHQNPDGGWSYQLGEKDSSGRVVGSSPTMTAAGIATLYITSQQVHAADAVQCKGNQIDKEIEKGLEWMVKFYGNGAPNYGGIGWGNYFIYGIERIGVASGRKYFGKVDWYQDGAKFLVASQGPDGNWGGSIDTAYALLFLVHGRAPVAINKLQYEIDTHGDKPKVANWNQRPRDAANLVKWMGKQSETLLNWQMVDLKVPVEELHDAPILYIAGDQTLSFTDEELTKLRLFVEQGGIIFGNADCNKPEFAASFKKLGSRLFNGYEFAMLPDKHIIFEEQFHNEKWKNKPKVEILSNGARLLMVLVPQGDPSRFWQVEARSSHEEYWQLMADLFLYSVDKKGIRAKGSTYIVIADPNIKPSKTIKVARLQYAGNWDPEPGGWRRLAAVMHNSADTDLDVQPVKLGDGKLDNSFKVAHLTGTFAFRLDDSAAGELKKYIDGGGTLVIDSAGGTGDFSDSAQKMLGQIVPGAKLGPSLRMADPLFAAGEATTSVAYRAYTRRSVGEGLKWARLKAIDVNQRHAIIFSSEDLSVGLVGQEVDGIIGYTPATATALMRNILCYSVAPNAVATQPAATQNNSAATQAAAPK